MKNRTINLLQIILLALLIGLISGCASRQEHYSSSVIEYLYSGKQVVQKPEIPTLALPLKVGIAFVPESFSYTDMLLSESQKMTLLEKVAKDFKQYSFVESIEIIPSDYLVSKGGFRNLDQLRTMYGVDVIALVSFDQKQFTDEGVTSLAYWTIVGVYIVPGEKNDTHTMLDVAVYDIKSRKMLFRAPGISHVKGLSTPVNLTEELRNDGIKGFNKASEKLIVNLNQQLDRFKKKVKESPQNYKVIHREGYTGGGSVDTLLLVMMMLTGGYGLWMRKR